VNPLNADIDECESVEQNDCGPNALCTNTEGSYLCRCDEGYTGDGKTCAGITQSDVCIVTLLFSPLPSIKYLPM